MGLHASKWSTCFRPFSFDLWDNPEVLDSMQEVQEKSNKMANSLEMREEFGALCDTVRLSCRMQFLKLDPECLYMRSRWWNCCIVVRRRRNHSGCIAYMLGVFIISILKSSLGFTETSNDSGIE